MHVEAVRQGVEIPIVQLAQNKTSTQDDEAAAFIHGKKIVFTKHSTPGRARFFVRGLFDSDFLKSCLEHELSQKSEVFFCSANTRTGNLLVRFRDDCEVATLRDIVEGIVHNLILMVLHDPLAQKTIQRETIHAHVLSAEETCHLLATCPQNGLSEKESTRRLRLRGANLLPLTTQTSTWTLFTNQFQNFPSALLAGSALLSIATGGALDAALVGAVLLINGYIGFHTQKDAHRIIASIDRDDDEDVCVIRDGIRRTIPPSNLVVGDVVKVRSGRVAADMRLLTSRLLSVDESTLTGESVPVRKNAARCLGYDALLGQRDNMLYRGTTVMGGDGTAIVTAIGSDTEVGRIQKLVNHSAAPQTPLQKDLHHIGQEAVLFTSLLCGGVFFVGILRGISLKEMLQTVISLSVAAIPEGLPTIDTTALAHGVKKLKKDDVIIKNLHAVETLGAVDVVCLDKTGTLTLNDMTLEALYVGQKRFSLQDGHIEHWEKVRADHPEVEQLFLMTVLCCEATTYSQDGNTQVYGSGTETAFLKAAMAHGIDVDESLSLYERYKTEGRSEGEPYMRTYHKRVSGNPKLLAIKGSPLAVLDHCTRFFAGEKVHPIHPSFRKAIEEENEKMAAHGLRVLGVAFQNFEHDPTQGEWIWIGLAGLKDPLRPGLKPLIESLKRCGIHVCVLTGDQSSTALAIGRELNLNGSDSMQVLDAEDIAQLSDDELQEKIKDAHIFSRVNPSQKLRIVNAFQKSAKVVAMTGDGVNDGPALKIADVGITMGHQGAQTARSIADVVVADDRLESLLKAIQVGRQLRKNLLNSVSFILSTNISESLVMLGALFMGARNPFNAKQLLWINLVTDIFPAMALALEAPHSEQDVTTREIGDSLLSEQDRSKILRHALILTAGTLTAYQICNDSRDKFAIDQASTAAALAMVSGQMLHAWQSRHRQDAIHPAQNRMLMRASIGGLAAQLLTIAWPTMRNFLQHRPLAIKHLTPVLLGSLGPYLINRYLDSPQTRQDTQLSA